MSKLILLSVLFATSFAAASTARMALPTAFETRSARLEIDGFGGRNNGSYRFIDPDGTTYSGDFSRTESRLGVLDPMFVKNKAGGAFSFRDPPNNISVFASCRMRKDAVNVDIVTLDRKKMLYRCEFRSEVDPGNLNDARLVIGQPKRQGFKELLLAQDLRCGEVALYGQHLLIESVHTYKGSKFSSQSPVGYLLKSGDEVVAAIELTDVNPALYIVPGASAELQRTIYVSALAIGVFRDPANSALEPL